MPEEREIFANVTVDENLRIGMQPPRPGVPTWTIDQMYAFFPQLKERRNTAAGMLSGGEQQMLTICRSLLGNPRVILIDEPTEGLAPKIVEVVTEVIRDICRQGVSVLLVEQKLTIAMRVSTARLRHGPRPDRLRGHARTDLRKAPDIRRDWLEVN